MAARRFCRPRVLATGPGCRVSLCDHQTVHLDLGALTFRLSPQELEAVAHTLVEACVEAQTGIRAGRRPLHS